MSGEDMRAAGSDVPRMLNHYLPLTPDESRRAALTLPSDLTMQEAMRITAFVHACVVQPAATGNVR